MPTVADRWNRKMDAVIEAVDGCRDDDIIVRRSCLDNHLRTQGLMLHAREMLAELLQRCRFFEHAPVKGWLNKVFPGQVADPEERALRLTEEVMELAQTEGVTREQLHALVDQVMDKPVGDREQELGGVTFTLASYCVVRGLDASEAFATEFERCNDPQTIIKIQRKHALKLVVSSKIRP